MSRTTSMRLDGSKIVFLKMDETVHGEGETTADALQSLLDNMEVRCDSIRQELRKLRGERP